MYQKKTKIVATLGPACETKEAIKALAENGINVARLNFSHGTYEDHQKLINNIHAAEKSTGLRIAILQDLQGPKIRLGELPKEGFKLEKNEIITFTIAPIIGRRNHKETIIPVAYKGIVKDCKKNQTILLKDGEIETKILKVEKTLILAKVITPGLIKSHNGLSLPNGTIKAKTLTDKDKKDALFGIQNNVDFVALSFVKNKKDILELRKFLEENGSTTPIIAKIERHEAIKNLEEIIRTADGIMVARGDLGTDIPLEHVPIIQKRIIHLSNKYGKPVITATEVLQSMVTNSRPTRAEISDAANAVLDHTDAIMLSNETAVGKYPIKAVNILARVITDVEKEIQNNPDLMEEITLTKYLSIADSTLLNACDIAYETNANFIVVHSPNGREAISLAKYRPYTKIITICDNEKTARILQLNWGLSEIITKPLKDPEKEVKTLIKKKSKIVFIHKHGARSLQIANIKI